MRCAALIAVGLVAAYVGSAQGETVRCGSALVDESTTVEELLRKCGQPTSKRQEEQDVRAKSGTGTRKVGTTIVEYWTYDRGTQAAPMVVTIVDGKISSLELER
jgi:hypothetical protein